MTAPFQEGRFKMKQFNILECNMDRLEKKLVRIANKCKKYDCDFSYNRIGEEFKTLKDEEGKSYIAKYIIIEVEGTANIAGWKFVAEVEHTEKGNIISGISDLEVPERYYSAKPVCEHCGVSRYRKNTYVVQNEETGEFVQVGKSCLKDYTGGMSAEGVAQFISAFDELIKGEEPYTGHHAERFYKTEDILRFAAETIKHFGYVRTQDSGRSTASRSFDYYGIEHGHNFHPTTKRELEVEMDEVGFNHESADTVELVQKSLEWVSKQEESNNYIHNLKTACSLEYTSGKNLGIVVSLLPTFNRELEFQAEKAERERKRLAEQASEVNSKHIGKIGERISVDIHSVKCLTSWETDFGTTRIYKIVDVNGNVFTWKTGNFIEENVNFLKGTVKEHKEYNGINQTELTRCKVERKGEK